VLQGYEESKVPEGALSPFPAGEDAAMKRLEAFAEEAIAEYDSFRDVPSLEKGTSGMSPYLAIGSVSAKQCLIMAYTANHNMLDTGKKGCVRWIQEVS